MNRNTATNGSTAMDRRERVARVLALHPLIDVIEESGQHRIHHASGNRVKMRCFAPDHADRDPSLYIDLATQKFRCFGGNCGIHGNLFDYLAICYGTSFAVAMRDLDGNNTPLLATVTPLRPPPPPEPPSDGELRAVAVAADFYAHALKYARQPEAPAVQYLKSRGLSEEQMRVLGLGFGARGLPGALRRAGVPIGPALSIGVLAGGKGDPPSALREPFRGRLIVPERARDGSAIWMTGRVLPTRDEHGAWEEPDIEPRYFNTRKQKPLLGLGRLPEGQREVVLGEGPFDWLAGKCSLLPGTVASLGPPSAAVIEQLKRFDRVYVAYDADAGGDGAAATVAEALGDRAVRVQFPDGLDMGDFAQLGTRGKLRLNQLVREAAGAAGATRAA